MCDEELLKYSVVVPRSRKFFLKFLGSIEVSYHRGNDVLCQAINKVSLCGSFINISSVSRIMCLL